MTAHSDDTRSAEPVPPHPPGLHPEAGPDPLTAQPDVRQSTVGVPYRSDDRNAAPAALDGAPRPCPAVPAPGAPEESQPPAAGRVESRFSRPAAGPATSTGSVRHTGPDQRPPPGAPYAAPPAAGQQEGHGRVTRDHVTAPAPGNGGPAAGRPDHLAAPATENASLSGGHPGDLPAPAPEHIGIEGGRPDRLTAPAPDNVGLEGARPDHLAPPARKNTGFADRRPDHPAASQEATGFTGGHAASSGHDGDAPRGTAAGAGDGAFVPPEAAVALPSRERRLRLALMACGAAVTIGVGVAIALLMEGASPPLRLGAGSATSSTSAAAPPAHISSGASGVTAGDSGGGAAPPGDPACPLAGGPAGCPAMVAIPAGRYRVGTVRGDPDAQEEELGGAERAIAAFELSSHEITAGQWQLCVNDGACPPPVQAAASSVMPVTGISWDAAVAYTAWLSDKTGRRYRLPTEAEWEYAARGGAATPFPWGARLGQRHAHCGQCGTLDLYPRFAPVGSFAPHHGLYDMVGNAYEWVADCWAASHAQPSPPQSACRDKVQKGGAFDTLETGMRPVARTYGDRTVADVRVGFRVAREAQPAAPVAVSHPTAPRGEQ